MLETLRMLVNLQLVDLRIRDLSRARDVYPEQLRVATGTVDASRNELEVLRQSAADHRHTRDRLQNEMRDENEKVKKWERRLDEVRNTREFQALSREIELAKRSKKDLEEQAVAELGAIEDIEKRLPDLQEALDERLYDFGQTETELKKKIAELEAQMASEEATKKDLLAHLKPTILRRYDQVRAKRDGIAVVPVEDGGCNGCNMQLPPQLYNIIQRGTTLESCPSCHRFLYFAKLIEAPAETKQETVS